jgi:hypothetical protein
VYHVASVLETDSHLLHGFQDDPSGISGIQVAQSNDVAEVEKRRAGILQTGVENPPAAEDKAATAFLGKPPEYFEETFLIHAVVLKKRVHLI